MLLASTEAKLRPLSFDTRTKPQGVSDTATHAAYSCYIRHTLISQMLLVLFESIRHGRILVGNREPESTPILLLLETNNSIH